MKISKHIAMWSSPRSRSTLVARSFEQLDGCIVYDEPLYAPYLLTHALDHPERELVIHHCETDYHKVIQTMIGDLPNGHIFSFQKQMAKHALPNLLPALGRDWLQALNHFFLLRNPKEIIASYAKVCKIVTPEEIGMKAVYDLFKEVESLTGQIPLVIDSTDLIKNPRGYLSLICSKLEIPFSDKMLSWQPGLKHDRKNPFPWLWTGQLPPTPWYDNIDRSTGFITYQDKEVDLPKPFDQVFEQCLPFYEKLCQYRQTLN
jgi:hypothetical protein